MQPNRPHTCALYARYSPKPKGVLGESYTIESQLDACRELALAKFGCAKPDAFIERDVSGATLDRPELDRLRDAVAAKLYDAVIVYSPDRLARQRVDSLILREEFLKRGVKLEFVSGSYADSPEGDLSFDMISAVAEYERKKFAERSRRGRKRKAREGFVHSGNNVPFGYRYRGIAAGSRGEYEIIPEQAAVVKRIFELTKAGHSNYSVAMKLNAEGIPTQKGNRWWRESVSQVTRKTVYYGEITSACGIVVPVPKIIERDLWVAAHEAHKRNHMGKVGRPSAQYLLSGFLWCALCGARCKSCAGTRRVDGIATKGYKAYRCNGVNHVDHRRICHAPSVRKEALESVVWDAIWAALKDPALLWSLIEAYHDRVAAKPKGKRDPVEARMDRARRRVARAQAILLDPDNPIPYADAKAALDAARRELVEAETARGADVLELPRRADITVLAREFSKAYVEIPSDDFAERRGVVERVVDKIRYAEGEAELHCHVPLPRKCNSNVAGNYNSFDSFPFILNVRIAA